jgi:CrcB protein
VSALGWVCFVIAGAVGAPARYLVDGAISGRAHHKFPRGTLVVNITGSFVLGFVTGLALYHSFPRTPRLVIGTGFCGAYTTFSTFAYDTIRLAEAGDRADARANVLATLVLGALAAATGLLLAAL